MLLTFHKLQVNCETWLNVRPSYDLKLRIGEEGIVDDSGLHSPILQIDQDIWHQAQQEGQTEINQVFITYRKSATSQTIQYNKVFSQGATKRQLLKD
jgi:hypothetical protein